MNRSALISVLAAALTVISFCVAVAPIPLTGWVCYPAAAALGLLALATGLAALAQLRSRKEEGRTYAWIGIWVGGLAFVASLCLISAGLVLMPKAWDLVRQYVH